MTRSINIKLLLLSLMVLALVALSIHLLHQFQMQRNAEVLLRQALAQKDPKKAIHFFRHYLVYQPEDHEARAKYVLTLEKTGVPAGQLRGELEKVLRRDPRQHEVRYRLVHNLIQLHRFGEAIAELEKLLPHWPNKAELEHMLGWCQEASGDYAAAVDSFGRAIQHDPHKLESYLLLAEVLDNRLDLLEEAQQAMDRLVKANPASYRAYLLRARFLQSHQQMEAAEKDLQQALSVAPQEVEVLLAVAEMTAARGQLDLARKHVELGLKGHPQNVALYRALAHLDVRAGQPQQAIASLRRGLKQMPDANELLFLLADLLIDENKLKEAEEVIANLDETKQAAALVTFLHARLQLRNRRWTEAASLLEKARADLPSASAQNGRVNFFLGLCYEQLGDTVQQLAAFQRAVQQEPLWTLARFGLGSALLAAGHVLDALTELEQVRKAADAPPAVWTALARARLVHTLRQPEKRRDWIEVEQALDQAAKFAPKEIAVAILRAEVLAARKRFAEAAALLEKTWTGQPKEVRLPCALADLYVRQKQWPQALAVLDQAQKQLGDHLEIRLARCRLEGAQGGTQASQVLPKLANHLEGYTPDEQTRLLRELADTWFRLGYSAPAAQLWRQLAQRQPNDLRSRLLLFDVALQNRQNNEAKQLLSEIRQLEGEAGFHWRCAEVALILMESPGDAQQLAQARKRLQSLGRRQRQEPWVAFLEARIDELEDRPDQAIVHYQRGIERGDLRPRMVFRLVQLLNEQRRFVEAEQTLRLLEELLPLDRDLARLGAEAALANHNLPRAQELAKQAVPADSRDYRDLLWLARILHLVRQDKQAEEVLRRGVQLAGHTPDTWAALVSQLVWQGDRAQAEAVLADSQIKLPADRAPLALALGQEVLGQLDRAEETYRQAWQNRPDDFLLLMAIADFMRRTDQPAKAVPFLEKLLEPATDAPVEHILRGRRLLAWILGTDHKPEHFQQALALLEANKKSRGPTPADNRVLALVLGRQLGQEAKALADFEASLKLQPPTLEEELGLAQLYEAAGDPLRAREVLQNLLGQQPENPQILSRLGQLLVRQEELTEAQGYCQRLAKLEPASPRTLTLQKALAQARDEAK